MVRTIAPRTESSSQTKVRQRVPKACQRCRLKKCKCDGCTPCSRCKSDDAICAYPKHQHFDKIVYRKGYVQMLERQQAQLIAGVQGLHQMIQKGDGLPLGALETSRTGQPLVHQILQRLGVLEADDPWDEIDPEECKSESPSTELDSAVDTNFPPESQYLGPGDVNSCSPLEASLAPSQAWSRPSAGNATLFPWATAPCQFLGVEHSQSTTARHQPTTDLTHCSTLQSSDFDPSVVDEPTPGPYIQTRPSHPIAEQNFSSSLANDRYTPPGAKWSAERGDFLDMIGECNGQPLRTLLSKPAVDASGYGWLTGLR